MRISHDKVSGALYIKLLGGRYDHTDFSEKADVYLDVDADGDVFGLEALSFEDLAAVATWSCPSAWPAPARRSRVAEAGP